jgi:hypothetical protein
MITMILKKILEVTTRPLEMAATTNLNKMSVIVTTIGMAKEKMLEEGEVRMEVEGSVQVTTIRSNDPGFRIEVVAEVEVVVREEAEV